MQRSRNFKTAAPPTSQGLVFSDRTIGQPWLQLTFAFGANPKCRPVSEMSAVRGILLQNSD
jgi:hypothetical protein